MESEGKRRTTIYIAPTLYERLRVVAFELRCSINSLVVDGIKLKLKELAKGKESTK